MVLDKKRNVRTTSAECTQDGNHFEEWCGWRDLNPHALRHQNLNLACLPISPHPRRNKWQTTLRLKRGLYSIADFPVKGKSSALPHRKSDFSTSARSAGFRALSRSSAINPGPASRPASPCSQTAIAAASKPETPCASRPTTIPASTSPDPAVASHGGALQLIAARPSGAATTLSGPFQNHDSTGHSCCLSGTGQLATCKFREKASKLSLMRRQNDRRIMRPDAFEKRSAINAHNSSDHRHRTRLPGYSPGSPLPQIGSFHQHHNPDRSVPR